MIFEIGRSSPLGLYNIKKEGLGDAALTPDIVLGTAFQTGHQYFVKNFLSRTMLNFIHFWVQCRNA